MKKNILLTISLFVFTFCFGQEEMTTVWESKMEHKTLYAGTGSEDRGVSYSASDKKMTVFSNKDGSVVWSKPFKEMAPKLRKIDELIPFWESDCVFLFDRKLGKDQIAVIDLKSGKLLWNTDKYQNVSEATIHYAPDQDGFAIVMTKGLVKKSTLVFIKAKTGEEVWETEKLTGVIGFTHKTDDGKYVVLNYAPSGLQFILAGFKSQIMKMDFESGDILWDSPYMGVWRKKVVTKEKVGKVEFKEGKIFLLNDGLQVFDEKTGSTLWSASYNFTPSQVVGKPAGTVLAFGVYGAVADPLIIGRDVYVLEMSNKKNQKLKKYDINSGRLLWTSPEIQKAKAIPNMYVINDVVVLQIGGAVECQSITRTKDAEGNFTTHYNVYYKNVKPTGIQAFNSDSGKKLWDSEKFKKGITNMIPAGDDILICSGKALYKYKSGEDSQVYEINLNEDGIGLAELILSYEDQVIIVADKGISSHNISDGALKATAKYKKSFMESTEKNKLIMKTAKADIACYNLDTIIYKQFKAKKGALTELSLDSKFVYVYEKKVVTKLSTD